MCSDSNEWRRRTAVRSGGYDKEIECDAAVLNAPMAEDGRALQMELPGYSILWFELPQPQCAELSLHRQRSRVFRTRLEPA